MERTHHFSLFTGITSVLKKTALRSRASHSIVEGAKELGAIALLFSAVSAFLAAVSFTWVV